jgi:hypothetical protein
VQYLQMCLQFAVNDILIHENSIQLSAKVIFCTRNTEVNCCCQHWLYVLCDLPVKIKGNLVRMERTEENTVFIHVWESVGHKWIKLWEPTSNIMYTEVIKANVQHSHTFYQPDQHIPFQSINPEKQMHLSHHLTLHWNMYSKPFLSF